MTVQMMTDYLRNEKRNGIGQAGKKTMSKFWNKFQINEWTFSLFLFVLSLGIVAGKILINYGTVTQWSVNVHSGAPSSVQFSNMYDAFTVQTPPQLSGFDKEHLKVASEKLMNASRQYGDAMAGAVVGISDRYGWFIRAAMSGLAMMGITWFIIYKDSSIPGVNPPSPFSPSKRRYPVESRLQINYILGLINGVLIFVYMCL